MTLKELIEYLERKDPAMVVRNGFGFAMSYRGYYECLGFTPVSDAVVGDMLEMARKQIG